MGKRKARGSMKSGITTPELSDYDVIAISSSGGKDSQAMLSHLRMLTGVLGIADRIVVIHADLGTAEWPGTKDTAKAQADHFGARFEVCTRIGAVAKKSGKVYEAGDTYGPITDYAGRRGAWPSNQQRWCTSDFKRGPILTVFTRLAKEWRQATGETRACRILDCQGLRAEESPARAKKESFQIRKRSRTQSVDTWLPIHSWTTEGVWDEIKISGAPHHWAYDIGMPRLSCVFCIFAPKAALILAGRHNRKLLDEYVSVENRTGHTFRQDLALADILEEIKKGDQGAASDWDDHGCSGISAEWNM